MVSRNYIWLAIDGKICIINLLGGEFCFAKDKVRAESSETSREKTNEKQGNKICSANLPQKGSFRPCGKGHGKSATSCEGGL